MKPRRALLFTLSVVLALCAACGVWLHRERRQYALNRQLIDALDKSDFTQATALVQSGADPNTRLMPTPAPTFKRLLNQLLHHTPLPVNDSPTAFFMICGSRRPLSFYKGYPPPLAQENLPLLQVMFTHGANLHARAQLNLTALHYAIGSERWHTAEWLLQHGSDVNAVDAGGDTPLMYVDGRSPTLTGARLLLAEGANPNVPNEEGNTSLHLAVSSPIATTLIPFLLSQGADPNVKNHDGETPRMLAQKEKRPDIMRLLKEHGAK
jgi:hypothetical protein